MPDTSSRRPSQTQLWLQRTRSFLSTQGPRPSELDIELEHEITQQQTEAASEWAAAKMSLPLEIAFVSVVCLAQFCTQVGLGQTVAILHIIGEDFGVKDPAKLTWQMAGQGLTTGTFILISGRLGDIYGYKRVFLCGVFWFCICNMVSGVAVYSDYVLFIFSRVLQGIGPAVCLPNGLAIFGSSYAPGGRKAMVFAIFAAVSPAGSVIGSLSASLIALAWWPWAYWSFSIVLLISVVVGYFVIPTATRKITPPKGLRSFIACLDVPGAIVGVTSLILFNFAWNQAPIVGWNNAQVIVTHIVSIALIPLFFFIEIRIAQHPLIPFDAIDSNVAFVLASIACGWGSFGIYIFYSWEIWLISRQLPPLLATAWVCPIAAMGAIAAIITVAFLVGVTLMSTAPIDQIYWAQTFVAILIMPIGLDMSFPAGTLILSDAVEKENQGIAASLVNTVVNYSMSLALGFAVRSPYT
ncbi:hypothetical protein CBS147337_9898 [Penicillium roqueforti]|nr:hypothetical protein CBS147337_9898 [Penicillium roqueforti]